MLSGILDIQESATRAQEFALILLHAKFNEQVDQREEALGTAFLKATDEPKNGSYISSKAVTDRYRISSTAMIARRSSVFEGLGPA